MGKVGKYASAEVGGGKKGRCTTYLVPVHQKHEAARVYAVVAISVEAALAQLARLTLNQMETEVVGALSRDLSRRLGLKPGEVRPI